MFPNNLWTVFSMSTTKNILQPFGSFKSNRIDHNQKLYTIEKTFLHVCSVLETFRNLLLHCSWWILISQTNLILYKLCKPNDEICSVTFAQLRTNLTWLTLFHLWSNLWHLCVNLRLTLWHLCITFCLTFWHLDLCFDLCLTLRHLCIDLWLTLWHLCIDL